MIIAINLISSYIFPKVMLLVCNASCLVYSDIASVISTISSTKTKSIELQCICKRRHAISVR